MLGRVVLIFVVGLCKMPVMGVSRMEIRRFGRVFLDLSELLEMGAMGARCK